MPTHAELKEILADNDLSKLLGMEEGLHFEAKKAQAYEPFEPQNLYELAKDVSSFANAEGGLIILGLETEPISEKESDKVTGLNLFEKKDFDSEKFFGRINELVYPKVKDLNVVWMPSKDDPSLGVGCIEIPKQDERKKYFLMQKISSGKKFLKEYVFGIAIRQEAKVVIKDAQDLHALIQKGLDPAKEQRDRIEGKLDHLLREHKEANESRNREKAEERIRRILGLR